MAKLAKNRDNLRFNEQSRDALLFTTLELFNNAISHSRSTYGVFVCGQYYPNNKALRFSLCDAGIGITQNVAGYLGKALTGTEAINWALKRGNSTRVNRPGGMGLYFLKNFATSNGGNMHIVSGNTVFTTGVEEQSFTTEKHYSGTYICIEINTDISSTYVIEQDEELESNDLF